MNKSFCTECGHKMEYTHAKPKFCSSCGTPTGGVAVQPVSSPRMRLGRTVSESAELDEDETDVEELPVIQKIQVELESEQAGGRSLGSFFGKNVQVDTKRRKAQHIGDFIDGKPRRGKKDL